MENWEPSSKTLSGLHLFLIFGSCSYKVKIKIVWWEESINTKWLLKEVACEYFNTNFQGKIHLEVFLANITMVCLQHEFCWSIYALSLDNRYKVRTWFWFQASEAQVNLIKISMHTLSQMSLLSMSKSANIIE